METIVLIGSDIDDSKLSSELLNKIYDGTYTVIGSGDKGFTLEEYNNKVLELVGDDEKKDFRLVVIAHGSQINGNHFIGINDSDDGIISMNDLLINEKINSENIKFSQIDSIACHGGAFIDSSCRLEEGGLYFSHSPGHQSSFLSGIKDFDFEKNRKEVFYSALRDIKNDIAPLYYVATDNPDALSIMSSERALADFLTLDKDEVPNYFDQIKDDFIGVETNELDEDGFNMLKNQLLDAENITDISIDAYPFALEVATRYHQGNVGEFNMSRNGNARNLKAVNLLLDESMIKQGKILNLSEILKNDTSPHLRHILGESLPKYISQDTANVEVLELLLDGGVDADHVRYNNPFNIDYLYPYNTTKEVSTVSTALGTALEQEKLDIAIMLIKSGADVNYFQSGYSDDRKNKPKQSIVETAMNENNFELFEVAINAGLVITKSDIDFLTKKSETYKKRFKGDYKKEDYNYIVKLAKEIYKSDYNQSQIINDELGILDSNVGGSYADLSLVLYDGRTKFLKYVDDQQEKNKTYWRFWEDINLASSNIAKIGMTLTWDNLHHVLEVDDSGVVFPFSKWEIELNREFSKSPFNEFIEKLENLDPKKVAAEIESYVETYHKNHPKEPKITILESGNSINLYQNSGAKKEHKFDIER